MTHTPLHRRLTRLEAASDPAWKRWAHRPMDQWPDAALEAYIRDCPDAELDARIRELQALPADAPLPDHLLLQLAGS